MKREVELDDASVVQREKSRLEIRLGAMFFILISLLRT